MIEEQNIQKERKIIEDDALAMIYVRNDFYKRKYYLLLSVYLISLLVIVVLSGMLTYLVKHPPHPLYFATDDAGRFLQDVPRDQPNMSLAEVSAWTVEAVEKAFSYDFMNYRSQLQDAQKYFSDYGWHGYMQTLDQSNNLLALTQRNLIVIANVVDSPQLEVEGILGSHGGYAWRFNMPMLITYWRPPYTDKSKFQNPVRVSVVVQRQDILSSYKGLGIVQVIGTLVLPASSLDIVQPVS
jgi:intracellular multiplication protein IcmL